MFTFQVKNRFFIFGVKVASKPFQERNNLTKLRLFIYDTRGKKLIHFEKKRFFSNFDQFSLISNTPQKGSFWGIGVRRFFANATKNLKISFYHLQTLGSCRGTSQLSVNIFWTSGGCLKLQKLDHSKKIAKKNCSTKYPPLLTKLCDILKLPFAGFSQKFRSAQKYRR